MEEHEIEAPRGLLPGPPLRGSAWPPGSKSLAQRALVCALACSGETRLANLPDGEDVCAALGLAGLAAPASGGRARVATEHVASELVLGQSGTLARLASAAQALSCFGPEPRRLAGCGSLRGRSSPALFRSLTTAGARCEHEGRAGSWPVRIEPVAPPSELVLEDPGSSQEVSALLIALASGSGERRLRVRGEIPSRPYVELTRGVLVDFGVQVREPIQGDFVLTGSLRAPTHELEIEPDASSAAVLFCAACLSDGELRVPVAAHQRRQGDWIVLEHLAAFGCRAGAEDGALLAGGRPVHGARLDLSETPDLAPPLAAIAAAAALGGSESLLTGLGTLPGKESDRLRVLAEILTAVGVDVRRGEADLSIRPSGAGPAEAHVLLDPCGDHRMAFAGALLGLLRPGVLVRDPGCVAKSWPGFWEQLATLGARPHAR